MLKSVNHTSDVEGKLLRVGVCKGRCFKAPNHVNLKSPFPHILNIKHHQTLLFKSY